VDKQQAIDFVLDELDKGRSLSAITAALSSQLGAPADLVGKFVSQTAERYAQSKGVLPPTPPSNPPLTVANRWSSSYGQSPSAPDLNHPGYGQPPAASDSQPTAYSRPPVADSQETGGFHDEAGTAAAMEAIPEPNPRYIQAPAAITGETSFAPEKELEAATAPDLEKFILGELGKNKREGDIVLAVVERTGMEYRQAQRMVSRVGARNYKKVAAKQNCLIIPLAVVFLIAGLVLLGASVAEGYQLRFILNSPNNLSGEQIQQAYDRGRDLPWAFITGLALSLGGSIGLFSALRKQMD